MATYNINCPWESLDPWQKEYIETDADKSCFLLCGRQVGKTTAMSIKAVELCVNKFTKGQNILICSITEKQAYRMLAKALSYAEVKYKKFVKYGKDKPTMHRILFTNGTGIFCYAAGETGEGLRGDTIKKLMIDEGSRMSEEFFISVTPMLSITKGSMDIASTPCGKEGFFYECSKDETFKKFYVNAEDCPRHDKEFLEKEKQHMTKVQYAQEYEAIFTDELKRLVPEELIKNSCVLKRIDIKYKGNFYLGCDIAGFGEDDCTYEIFERLENNQIEQRENIVEKRNMTTDTSRKIISLCNSIKEIRKIGIDDAGVGFGVYSELMNEDTTKRKTIALNNASRTTDKEGERNKKLLKEEMYFNLLSLMETNRIKMLDDDEIKDSLRCLQYEEGKVFGHNRHISEGIIRAVWLAEKEKGLNIFAHSF